ncbi:MAG: hypothetical protein MI975_01285 [Cytophagales bacterium]|nr:hypothetical protein [Cytophagales bacterium]
MVRRIFPSDKNYILQEVQTSQRDTLLKFLVRFVKRYYLQNNNPLGLIDDTILEIQREKAFSMKAFDGFYYNLSAIYRFKYGEVQLEFLFDGSSHYEKYVKDWSDFFKQHVKTFCLNRFFVRAVLDLAVFHNQDRVAYLAGDRLKYFLSQYYALKVYKYKGITDINSQAS